MSSRPADTGLTIKQRRWISLGFRYLVALVAIAFAMYPVLLIISASLNPVGRLMNQQIIPANASLDNYRQLWSDPFNPFPLWLWNSIKVSGITTVLAVIITAFAAYAFSRFRFTGRRNLLLTLVLVQVFPNLLTIVALFLLLQELGNYIPFLSINSHGGLILVYLGGVMGINVWLMKGFFDSIPSELDESAKVDGASDWQIFWRIIFPLVRPILAVIAVLTFIGTFGDFILASVLLQTSEQYTFMVGLYRFISGTFNENWGVFAAGAVVGAVPIVAIYLILQDQIVSGLTAGSVKG
ncbi:MAG: sugar ABC transporter permease [Chloroflexota bacterium]|nr:sugar ABC transporter permease [Chloroflexota bacterium]